MRDFKVVPYAPEHLLAIAVQPMQRLCDAALQDPQNARELGAAGPCFTALEAGTPIAIAGIVDRGPGRAIAWAVLSPRALENFAPVHRAVKRFLTLYRFRRLEMTVDPRHAAAQRWAARLGFEREGLMRKYMPDGNDAELWAKVED